MSDTITPARSAKEQFDRQAAHYNAQWNAWSEHSLAWMLDAANPRLTDAVLDVATGTGFTAFAFAPHVQSVIGLDVSEGMLTQARREAEKRGLSNVTFQEGAAERLPFDGASFDLVTCRIAPHHFLDVSQFVSEAARVLKPGGALILTDTSVPDDDAEAADWQNRVEALRDPSHVRNYTPREWRGFAESARLAVREVHDLVTGITIPLEDWMVKAGCTPEQSAAVRQAFSDAPPSARQQFQVGTTPDGETVFTWKRVVLKAVKPQT